MNGFGYYLYECPRTRWPPAVSPRSTIRTSKALPIGRAHFI